MKIAIYGSASPKPGEQTYEEAYQLGFLLGKAGHTIMTGGYIGVMEAASKGAAEAGAHVIGSTCVQLENWRGTKANPWVKEEWKHETLRERMYALIDACDAAIIMPGGVGTMAELAVMWNEEIISTNGSSRAMILVGPGWQNTLDMFFAQLGKYIQEIDQKRVFCVNDIHSAIKLLEQRSNQTK